MRLHQVLQLQSQPLSSPKRPSVLRRLVRSLPLKWRSRLFRFLLLQYLLKPHLRKWLLKPLLQILS